MLLGYNALYITLVPVELKKYWTILTTVLYQYLIKRSVLGT